MNKENLTVHLKVKDFNAWRTSYNENEKDRASAGITNGRVFRSADDAMTWSSSRMSPTYRRPDLVGLQGNEVDDGEERRHRLAQHPLRRCGVARS
jgi:hypothetical protein